MPTVHSMGNGYYNYYNISSRYKTDVVKEAWYYRDLSKEEICSNNTGVLNKDSEAADLYRKLAEKYAAVAEKDREMYQTVDELKNALCIKYGVGGPYSSYSQKERNAMYINELSMACFGVIGSAAGSGYVLDDPNLKGEVSKNKGTNNKEFNLKTLAQQFMNVFNNNGIDISLLGNTKFTFAVDGKTKTLQIFADENTDKDLLEKMTKALNSNDNSKKLFYNMLYNASKQGKIPEDVRIKYLLTSDFELNTGLDLRDFKLTEKGFVNDKGEYARDIYLEMLKKSGNVPREFWGAAYDYFTDLEKQAMKYDFDSIPELELTMDYQNGYVMLDPEDKYIDTKI